MKHIDKLFKEKLYNHEVNVPEGMWEKIQPNVEDESGRALLWFWFAGILAILLAGFLFYQLNSNSATGPLAENQEVIQEERNETPSILVSNELKTEQPSADAIQTPVKEAHNQSISEKTVKPVVMNTAEKVTVEKNLQGSSSTPTASKAEQTQNQTTSSLEVVASSENVEIKSTRETFEVNPKPANILITKSYINEEGSIIKQFSNDLDNGPSYDVIINSEANDMNAAALMRIIPPIEKISLPAFENNSLKKKITI